MSNEKRPEPSGWRERLDDPTGDPERLPVWTPAEKDAVWERLHGRLGKGPRRKRGGWLVAVGLSGGATWYWAAASLLAIIGGLTLQRSGPTKGAGRGSFAATSETEAAAMRSTPAPAVKNRPEPGSGSITLRMVPDPAITMRHRGRMHVTPIRTRSAPARATLPAEMESAPRTDDLVGRIDPSTRPDLRGLAAVEKVVRPASPLRVIHNNELDPAPGPPSSLARNSSSPHWLRLGKRHGADPYLYSSDDGSSRPARPFITIHISPQN